MGENPADREIPERAAGELLQIFPERVVQRELPLLGQEENRRHGRHNLGERRHVEDRVLGHELLAGDEAPRAEGFPVEDALALAHEDDGPRNFAGAHRGLHGRVHAAEIRLVPPRGRRPDQAEGETHGHRVPRHGSMIT